MAVRTAGAVKALSESESESYIDPVAKEIVKWLVPFIVQRDTHLYSLPLQEPDTTSNGILLPHLGRFCTNITVFS